MFSASVQMQNALYKQKMALVSLCCKSHCFKTANIEILSTNSNHWSQLSHFYQSVACHKVKANLLLLVLLLCKKAKTRLKWLCVDLILSRESLTEENGVISLNEHVDSLEKVTTVKRVARVFRDLTPKLRDKRNRSLVHRPMCLNCHWMKFVGCRQFSILVLCYGGSVAEWLTCWTQAQ